jgi:oligopeptide transport system substrate-binding protein
MAARCTARDFVESWKRTLTPETGSQYNYQLYPVKNAEAFPGKNLRLFAGGGSGGG